MSTADGFDVTHLPLDFVHKVNESNPHTPEGANFTPEEEFPFITEHITIEEKPLDQTWVYLYESVANGKEYPIKDEEALKVMQVISEIKQQNIN